MEPNYFEIDKIYVNRMLRKTAIIDARKVNQKKFKYPVVFSTIFGKQDEDRQLLGEFEICINL